MGELQLTANGDLRVRDDDANTYLAMLAGALVVTFGAEAADGIKVSVQGGAWVQRIRLWLSETEYGAVSAVTSEVVDTGTELREIVNHGDYEIVTNAAGLAEVTWTIAGAATRYAMADVNGRVYSSGEITWAA